MKVAVESLLKTFYFSLALFLVLLGHSAFSRLGQSEEDFLYLSGIVMEATEGKETQTERLKALTRWLASHVVKTTELDGWKRSDYPSWFDGRSVASVIRGGVGNCGYQANNVLTLSKYLGIAGQRRYYLSKESGSKYEHAFAELIVDGKPGIFDPNLLVFQEGRDGRALGLQEMIQDPSLVQNQLFRRIVMEIKERPNVLRLTNVPDAPEPLGKGSYDIYRVYGSLLTRMYLHLKGAPLSMLVQAWLVFLVFCVAGAALARRTDASAG